MLCKSPSAQENPEVSVAGGTTRRVCAHDFTQDISQMYRDSTQVLPRTRAAPVADTREKILTLPASKAERYDAPTDGNTHLR